MHIKGKSVGKLMEKTSKKRTIRPNLKDDRKGNLNDKKGKREFAFSKGKLQILQVDLGEGGSDLERGGVGVAFGFMSLGKYICELTFQE